MSWEDLEVDGGNEKGRAGEGTAGKGKRMAVSTSYGGMTRVRFGGCIPRIGKSRLHDREAPLSCGWNVDFGGVGAKSEISLPPESEKPARAMTRTGNSTNFFPEGGGGSQRMAPLSPSGKKSPFSASTPP